MIDAQVPSRRLVFFNFACLDGNDLLYSKSFEETDLAICVNDTIGSGAFLRAVLWASLGNASPIVR